MKRFLPIVAAAAIVVAGVACSDSDKKSASTAATGQGATTQTLASVTAPSGSSVAAAADTGNPADLVKAVRPGVVRIRAGGQQTGPFGGVQREAAGTGTGFVVDTRGYVVTNNHVVTLGTDRPVTNLQVDLWDGRTVTGTLVGRDDRTDLAVIKIDANNLTALKFADPRAVEVGNEVLAIGFALDLGSTPTVTKGVVSAKDRVIDEQLNAGGQPVAVSISGAIQTDAAINPGNSGGPLLNMRGEVVGINTAGLSGGQGAPVQGIFFAVSSGVAQPIAQSIIETGKVERGYLGVSLSPITREAARAQGIKVEEGAGVARVERNSPAEKAGLRQGDVITKIGDQPVKNIGDVTNALFKYKSGQKVKVEVARGQGTETIEVTVGDRPASA